MSFGYKFFYVFATILRCPSIFLTHLSLNFLVIKALVQNRGKDMATLMFLSWYGKNSTFTEKKTMLDHLQKVVIP